MMDRATGRRLTRRTKPTRDPKRWVRDCYAHDAAERSTVAYVTERGLDGARWEIRRESDRGGLWCVWRTPRRGSPTRLASAMVTLTEAIVVAEREGA